MPTNLRMAVAVPLRKKLFYYGDSVTRRCRAIPNSNIHANSRLRSKAALPVANFMLRVSLSPLSAVLHFTQ